MAIVLLLVLAAVGAAVEVEESAPIAKVEAAARNASLVWAAWVARAA